jgi:hypothetical protein
MIPARGPVNISARLDDTIATFPFILKQQLYKPESQI